MSRWLLLLALVLTACPRSRGDDDDDSGADDDAGDDDAGDDDAGDDDAGDDDVGDDDVGDDDVGDDDAGDDDAAGCGLTATLRTGATETCNQTWTEGEFSMHLENGTCGSGDSCYGLADNTGVWVYPAELIVSWPASACSPSSIEVDIRDYTGVGAADVVAYNAGGTIIATGTNTTTSGGETVALTGVGSAVSVGISGCETFVEQVRVD
jgi:hypothetical protein